MVQRKDCFRLFVGVGLFKVILIIVSITTKIIIIHWVVRQQKEIYLLYNLLNIHNYYSENKILGRKIAHDRFNNILI